MRHARLLGGTRSHRSRTDEVVGSMAAVAIAGIPPDRTDPRAQIALMEDRAHGATVLRSVEGLGGRSLECPADAGLVSG